MDKLVAVVAWPGVVLLLGLVALLLFRSPIAALIGRTRKVGKAGLETFEGQPTQPTVERKGVDEYFKTFENPLLLEQEGRIVTDLKDRGIDAATDREKALVRTLASTQLVLGFEIVYGLIWASQVAALRFMNPRNQGTRPDDLLPFYEAGRAAYPSVYEHYSVDQWLGFLRASNLILERDSHVYITILGREFLKYIITMGKTGPYYG